jgi:hypothetical protein
MSTLKVSKINQLISLLPQGAVVLSSWLNRQGYSPELQKRYRKSGWLESIGAGAMIRAGDRVSYEGAIYALQTQVGSDIHPGGRSALAMMGGAQYLELAQKKLVLFGTRTQKLPSWFQEHDWGLTFDYHQSTFLPPDLGLVEYDARTFSIKVSGPARALMECLYLVPKKQELFECYELMEGMNNLRPNLVQQLLEECKSVKVKRLFMYLAEKAGHAWVQYLDLKKVDFGSGKRSLAKHGVYVPKYQITVPTELEKHDRSAL